MLILAGAGSGKTTVLINRIANLLQYGRASDTDEIPRYAQEEDIEIMEKGGQAASALAAFQPVSPWRILAITFTNKAAGELKDRLERRLGESANDIWACTFHSACVRMLRRDAEKLGFSNSFTIYDTSDSQSVAKKIIKDFEIDEKTFNFKSVLAEISRAKDAQISADDYLSDARRMGDIRRITIGRIYAEYMRRLKAADAMDFDDLIAFTVQLLQINDEVREYWQNKFQYVLIDEYQDTNHLQYLFASILAGGWGNICVVGDDDQSIYKFRGATIENILSFESEYKNCRTIRLEQNYRSTAHILDAANAVIRNNLGRKGKELWTSKGNGEKVELYVADNQDEEAQYVASKILADFSKGMNWSDHAILYRMNAQSSTLEFAFKRNGIPYRIVGGMRFFDRAEIKDILAYLNVINTPADTLRLERIINVPARGIGARSVELAEEIADREYTSLYEILCRADNYSEIKRAAGKMKEFAAMIDELRSFARDNTPDVLLDELLEKTGYIRALEEKHTLEDETRIENVKELKSSIISFMKESGDETLEGYLANVALYTDLDNYNNETDAVTMMTMHSSKGLEFPSVFIVGMEETIFPSIRAIGETEEMEEERRLCYVAITRAEHKLQLVCARQRMLFGRTTANRVSRFVDEIPEEHIYKNIPKGYGYHEKNREEREYSARRRRESARPYAVTGAKPQPKPQTGTAAGSDYAVGDSVKHKSFGSGVIMKMTPMGADYLLEINFSAVGTKRLMLRYVSQLMTKE